LTSHEILISIVIVHYKVPDFLQRACDRCASQLYDQTEVIVVDNASRDESKRSITEEFPKSNGSA